MMGGTVRRESFGDLTIIDVDTHLTEPRDLWSARAPVDYAERVPRVVDHQGTPTWVLDGAVLGRAGGGSVVKRDGTKWLGSDFIGKGVEDTHPAATHVGPRLKVMDELGIDAQIVYPNLVGFGGNRLADVVDPTVRLLCASLWNDAMAEMQEESGQRLFPMALVPWWDRDTAVEEISRAYALGLRGVNMSADPQRLGVPDLGEPYWDPMWEACGALHMPVNFHVGASETAMSWFGDSPWPSLGRDQKLALGSAMIYLSNAKVLGNLIFSGVLERHPTVKFVSVESGIGWIPFFLESLDYQLEETAQSSREFLTMKPSEYFRRQMYGCFWFEGNALGATIEAVGVDNCMFETDFPHPTCLYPDSLERVGEALGTMDDSVIARVMGKNAQRVYSLPGR